MLRAHTVDDVCRAEQAAMADLPEGALMQRAAAGLAAAVVDLLGGATASWIDDATGGLIGEVTGTLDGVTGGALGNATGGLLH